jgi:hypothetical protein
VGLVFRHLLFLVCGPKFERDNGAEDGDTEQRGARDERERCLGGHRFRRLLR